MHSDWEGWCGMVWCGVVWHGMDVWYGVVWYGMVWHDMVWCAKASPVQRRSKGQGVPRAKACVARQATRGHMHSDVGADTGDHCGGKGEQAWWVVGERLGAGLECVSGHV
jgi:hypothetical protein